MANRRESGRAMMSRDTGASCAFARMLRTGRLKPVIINVEGDSDINFYRWLTDCHVELNQNNGKKAALEAVATAIRTNKKGVVAIVDSDFDHILQIGPDRNVFRTDTHDIETMMLREDFLRISDPNLRDKKKSNNLSYDDIWSIIISIGKKIGKLRLISTEKKLYLTLISILIIAFRTILDEMKRYAVLKILLKKTKGNLIPGKYVEATICL